MALTLIVGSLVLVNSFFLLPGLNAFVNRYVSRTSTVSMAWAVALGSISLMRNHFRRISRKAENWQYSILLIIFFTFFLVFGLLVNRHQSDPVYAFFFSSVQPPLSSTTYGILCFYVASAAYRSFRMRSMDSAMMMLSAFIVMLGAVPIGEAIWSGFPPLSEFVMGTMNTSVIRAITIGLTVGAISQSMRNLLGIERGHMTE